MKTGLIRRRKKCRSLLTIIIQLTTALVLHQQPRQGRFFKLISPCRIRFRLKEQRFNFKVTSAQRDPVSHRFKRVIVR